MRPLVIGIIAGESSGDQLGARLMRALTVQAGVPVAFVGVGGPLMEAEGLQSFFPMSDIAVNGLMPVIRRLPLLLRHMAGAASSMSAAKPDVVIHIDAQDFNQRVARKLKRLLPNTPLVAYVSPTVWAWRPGRARKIARIYKHLLAVLPFEPAVHQKLGGPPTTYVGHPLMERLADFTPGEVEQAERGAKPFQLLLLPGSRHAEISRLLPVFGEAIAELHKRGLALQVHLPAVPHLREEIAGLVSQWAIKPVLIDGEAGKLAAFRSARAALAASGTVTLELALARVPTVVAYKVSYIEGEIARRLIRVDSASLPNLILGEKLLPEFIDWGWKAVDLANAVEAVLRDGEARDRQIEGLDKVHRLMAEGVTTPSAAAASIVLNVLHSEMKKGAV